jgi:hypothetical protein
VYSGSVDKGDSPKEPVSDVLYPVIDRIDKVRIIDDEEDIDFAANKVVGVVSATYYWRDVLKNVLPDGKEGLIAVFENSWRAWPTIYFTYQIK